MSDLRIIGDVSAFLAPAELTAIGRRLATLADGDKDLLDFAGELGEVETTLRLLAKGLDHDYELMGAARTADERDATERDALEKSARGVERAIVSLAQIAEEMRRARGER